MTIQNPQRGQPIDVNYIDSIVTQINELTKKVSNTSTVLSTVDNGVDGPKQSTMNNLRIFSKSISVISSTVTAGQEYTWYVDFNPNFIYRPVVTATVVNNTSSVVGNNIITVLKTISTNRVDGVLLFNRAGAINVSINVIAVGITTT